jgi:hypothetical protein
VSLIAKGEGATPLGTRRLVSGSRKPERHKGENECEYGNNDLGGQGNARYCEHGDNQTADWEHEREKVPENSVQDASPDADDCIWWDDERIADGR